MKHHNENVILGLLEGLPVEARFVSAFGNTSETFDPLGLCTSTALHQLLFAPSEGMTLQGQYEFRIADVGTGIAAMPTEQQRWYKLRKEVQELQAFKASMSAPKKPDGAFEFLYQHPRLGELTVHYMPEQGDVLAVYLCSKNIVDLLDGGFCMMHMLSLGERAYAKHCEEINTDLAIERRHG